MMKSILWPAAALIAIACARPQSAASLEPGDWRLLAVGQAGAQPSDQARRPWLRFDVDSGRVSGNLGCNRTAGPFTTRNDELRFGALMSTRMACADDALNRQESAVAGALQATDHYRLRADTLDLLQGANVLATFVRAR